MTKITYYDFCDIGFSSYFINGLLELAPEKGFQFQVSREVPEALRCIEEEMRNQWFWRLGSRAEYAIFDYQDKENFLFCIDASDLNGDITTGGIQPVLLDKCKYYFKVNFNAAAISANPALRPYAHKIKPLPIVFRVTMPQRRLFLPEIFGLNRKRWPFSIIRRRLRWLLFAPKIDLYRRLRMVEKDIDVYFQTFLYPKAWNPRYAELNLRRLAIIDKLKSLGGYKIQSAYVLSSEQYDQLEDYVDRQYINRYQQHQVSRARHYTYRNLMARSRLGIYVRGVDDCLSFKFGELMAMAKPIVGERFVNNRSQLYAYPNFDDQFAYDEPEALIKRVVYLLENPDELRYLGYTNGQTFDRQLAPKQIMTRVLEQLAS